MVHLYQCVQTSTWCSLWLYIEGDVPAAVVKPARASLAAFARAPCCRNCSYFVQCLSFLRLDPEQNSRRDTARGVSPRAERSKVRGGFRRTGKQSKNCCICCAALRESTGYGVLVPARCRKPVAQSWKGSFLILLRTKLSQPRNRRIWSRRRWPAGSLSERGRWIVAANDTYRTVNSADVSYCN
jgi:hypothetical protein